MLGQRHEFHMGETFLLDVGDQLVGQFAIVLHILAPARGMDLVDADRTVVRVGLGSLVHPVLVMPRMDGVDDDGTGARRNLMRTLHRIGLHDPFVVGVEDLVLVNRSRFDTRNEQLPDSRGAQFTHGVGASVPAVEISHHTYRMGIRSPHGECGAHQLFALDAVIGAQRIVIAQHARSQSLPKALMASLAKQVHVQIADGGQITVRVVGHHGGTVFIFGADAIIGHAEAVIGLDGRNECHENAIVFMHRLGPGIFGDDRHGFRQRTKHADRDDILMLVGTEMPAEHLVWIVERTVAYCIQVALCNRNGNAIFFDLGFCSHGKSVSMKCLKIGPCRVFFWFLADF